VAGDLRALSNLRALVLTLFFFLPQTLKFSFEGSWGLAEVALSKRQYSLSYLNQGD
jgi:hypothetical protein